MKLLIILIYQKNNIVDVNDITFFGIRQDKNIQFWKNLEEYLIADIVIIIPHVALGKGVYLDPTGGPKALPSELAKFLTYVYFSRGIKLSTVQRSGGYPQFSTFTG